MNYLCIDYGQKHCGLALATTPLAQPLEVVPQAKLLDTLASLINQHHITTIVIGLPEANMAKTIKKEAKNIASFTGLPVVFQDETLSSQKTRQKMAQAGIKRSKRQAKIDHFVAASILQDYLDTHAAKDLLQ